MQHPAPTRLLLRHGKSAWFVVAGAVVLIAGLAVATLPRHADGPRVLTGTTFVGAANRRCQAVLASLRPPFTGEGKKPTTAQVADSVDRAAANLDELVEELRAIPASPADEDHINGWLQDWNRYNSIGHSYAAALRADDSGTQIRVSREGDTVQRRADRFARANGLQRCQFHAVPHGGSDPFSGGM